MEDEQFRSLLNLFPVVRSRDYCAENEASNKTSTPSERDQQLMEWHDAWDELDAQENAAERSDREDPFWLHLRSSVAEKMGAENAGQFCKAFQKVHEQLVYKALPLDAVRQITTHMDTSESGSQEQ